MRPGIYCLMWKGRMTDEARSILFLAASEMLKKSNESLKVREGCVEATVSTKFTPAVLGSVSGCFFSAEGETEYGKFSINFLVRPNDIRDLDELREYGMWADSKQLQHPSANAHLN